MTMNVGLQFVIKIILYFCCNWQTISVILILFLYGGVILLENYLARIYFLSHSWLFSSESSTTVSSDDIEKQELDELSDEDEVFFFDANECLDDPTTNYVCKVTASDASGRISESENNSVATVLVRRREKLPEPVEMEKCVSLWSMIKNNVGKDLSKVCLPVYFNEPLSSLQKCFEDLEYSYLLDQAYDYGKKVVH